MSDSKIQLYTTSVYYKNKNASSRYVINRGSAGSGKSVAIVQLLINKFLNEKSKKIVIVRKTLPSLRASTHEAFLEVLNGMGVSVGQKGRIREEKQFLIYRYKDNILRFLSVDNPEKLKSSNYSYVFMEEATEFDYKDFLQLKLRLREPSVDGKKNQMFLAFNPIDEFHWIKEKVIGHKGVEEIHSTYKDNPFLQEDYIEELEDLINQDPNYYRIYALGEWGKLENLIYRNWSTIETPPGNLSDSFYGLDFGFNKPSALVLLCPLKDKKREIYLQELLYVSNKTNSELISRLQTLVPKDKPLYCDTAEPARIAEIKKAGFRVKASDKNVNDGIDFVKRFQLRVAHGAENIKKELRAYSWKMDKNGNVLDEPVKFMDHSMDAIRYAMYTHLKRNKGFRLRFIGGRRGR